MGKLEKQLDRFLGKKPKLGKGVYIASGAVVSREVTFPSSVNCTVPVMVAALGGTALTVAVKVTV